MTRKTFVVWFTIFFDAIKIFVLGLWVVSMLSGCSHNAVNYSDGVGLETTFRPDSGNFGITFRYGKIFSAVLRENSQVEMSGEGAGGTGVEGSSNPVSASTAGSVKVKIGTQITGYYVDAITAGATPAELNKYIESKSE